MVFVCLSGFFVVVFVFVFWLCVWLVGWILVFQDRVFLCSPVCLETCSVDQAGLELRDPPASASQVLVLKACANTAPTFLFRDQGFLWKARQTRLKE